ncbi:hypothetical protein SAMN05444280_1522 [Tangfeifania diversioriginum]|uniref:Uncharacterized protein n=1 Tax=Tangfeifania diversioriginum TaxID=1168035 RepID=A0A1M6P4K9_9BACT|nr:hypothetical protein SAMN05444280_1522 [Tangfeifania diversioriginum]
MTSSIQIRKRYEVVLQKMIVEAIRFQLGID